MSRPTQKQFEFARTIRPSPELKEPDVWFKELRLLSRLSSEECIRRIEMRPGLNILWSPPEETKDDEGLYQDSWGGHAAGKTLFCRILRYLMGDTTFCTEEVLASIEDKFKNGLWAVGYVRLTGRSWIVGRSLLGENENFAAQNDDINAVLDYEELRAGLDAFTLQLESLATKPLKDLYPKDAWRHLLPWLARDQEARYARVTAWRDSLSEADNPSTSMSKQYALMRAMLDLLGSEEIEAQGKIEALEESIRAHSVEIAKAETILEREMENLEARIRRIPNSEKKMEDLKVLAGHLESQREVREERLRQLEEVEESPTTVDARLRYKAAFQDVVQTKSRAVAHREQGARLREDGNRLMGVADRVRSAGVSDPRRVDENWCPHTLETAESRGCVNRRTVDIESMVTLDELERQANDFMDRADEAEGLAARLESQIEQMEAAADTAQRALFKATRDARKDAGAIEREIAQLLEIEQQVKDADLLSTGLSENSKKKKSLEQQQQAHRDILEAARKNAARLPYFNDVFQDIIKAVVGASVDACIRIDGNGLHLHASKESELSGAALETVKTLAFDLAGVVASIEGVGHHPRFIIHDGPREADMARVIFERFFVYAADRLEGAFSGQPSFQYIVTTTTPPPEKLQDRSRWLIEILSSKSKEERLLCENV